MLEVFKNGGLMEVSINSRAEGAMFLTFFGPVFGI